MNEPYDDDPRPPSKSMRKREAIALQKLGERLVAMREEDFATLPLPDFVTEAIREARLLKGHGALSRQRQYIGKLMREVDVEPLERALDAITERHNAHARLRR